MRLVGVCALEISEATFHHGYGLSDSLDHSGRKLTWHQHLTAYEAQHVSCRASLFIAKADLYDVRHQAATRIHGIIPANVLSARTGGFCIRPLSSIVHPDEGFNSLGSLGGEGVRAG